MQKQLGHSSNGSSRRTFINLIECKLPRTILFWFFASWVIYELYNFKHTNEQLVRYFKVFRFEYTIFIWQNVSRKYIWKQRRWICHTVAHYNERERDESSLKCNPVWYQVAANSFYATHKHTSEILIHEYWFDREVEIFSLWTQRNIFPEAHISA